MWLFSTLQCLSVCIDQISDDNMSHFAGVVWQMTHHFTAASYGEKSLSLASASDEIVITWFGHFVILAPKHGALPGSLFPWSLLCLYNYPNWRNDCLKYFFFLSTLSASWRTQKSGSIWRDETKLHPGADQGCPRQGEGLGGELAAVLPPHQTDGRHAWGRRSVNSCLKSGCEFNEIQDKHECLLSRR